MDSNLFWRRVRLWALVAMLVLTGAMLILMAIYGEWWWFGTFSVITITVGSAEALSYFVGDRHTISQRWGMWIKEHPVAALIALACYIIGQSFLCLHLIGYAFK